MRRPSFLWYSKSMETFKDKVIKYVPKIPKGKVVSYGQVAAACGSPRAARQVGQILRSFGTHTVPPLLAQRGTPPLGYRLVRRRRGIKHSPSQVIPWWRVVNNRGEISIKNNWEASKELQRHLLEKEGVKISNDLKLDMEKYRYRDNN
jgi:methylated-DNA-protein-cysteine methyltransferase related protein